MHHRTRPPTRSVPARPARSLLALLVLATLACPARSQTDAPLQAGQPGQPSPPIAKRVAHELVAHGHTRIDHYYWLHQRDDPEVIAYLEAENAYTEAATAELAGLRAELLAELRARIEQDDVSAPVRERDYLYYQRWVEGGEHPLYCRKPDRPDAPEQLLLDQNALASGHEFFAIDELELSESQQLLAYSADMVGRRIYTIHVKDLRSGELLADEVPATAGELEWANDDRTLLYVKHDPQTLRHYQILRHTLGTEAEHDALVYEEPDETYWVSLSKTKSRAWLLIGSDSTLTSEVRLLDAHAPNAEPWVFSPRQRGLEYSLDHADDVFYVLTNLDALNFRLMTVDAGGPSGATTSAHWRELVGHREDVLLEDFEVFAEHLVLEQRRAGLLELSVRERTGREDHQLAFEEPAYVAYTSGNLVLDTTKLRYAYESMTTPPSVFEYDMNTREATLLDRDEVPGGFDPAAYVSERLAAPARDGAAIPISLVARRDTPRDGSSPLLLYAYGSYGSSLDAEFSRSVLSLLDRGFVYAIAHVRGGEELGRDWYEHGKLLAKRNSFTDFIDCAEYLIASGWADRERVFAEGGSAGGLLVGAVLNMRPELFRGAIADVPFVDVVTTMLDESVPLTTSEYDEWGNPGDPTYYEYMLSYSPYDNVTAQAYPALLVTTGLHDSQVQYWEPAKWVAKLRALKTDDNLLLLRTDMSAGHGGKSGRLAALADTAFAYALLLDLAGLGPS